MSDILIRALRGECERIKTGRRPVVLIPGQIEIPLAVFREQVMRFEANLCKELQERYPDPARNKTFQGLFAV